MLFSSWPPQLREDNMIYPHPKVFTTSWARTDTLEALTPGGSRSSSCKTSSSNPRSASSFLGLFVGSLAPDGEASEGLSRFVSLTSAFLRSPFIVLSFCSRSRWIKRSLNSSLCCRQLSLSSFRFLVRLLSTNKQERSWSYYTYKPLVR